MVGWLLGQKMVCDGGDGCWGRECLCGGRLGRLCFCWGGGGVCRERGGWLAGCWDGGGDRQVVGWLFQERMSGVCVWWGAR